MRRKISFAAFLVALAATLHHAAILIGQNANKAPVKPADSSLKLPPGWNKDDPLPQKKSNCVRCHLTAGRELTVPVRDFARSVHDRAGLSCNDCHGGDTTSDATAHEGHGFIGTKLSAHMARCSECHPRQAESFHKGKHFWDLTKSINRKYPVCIDCHGNHDVGKPPTEFSLMNVCTDCHKQFAKDQPQATLVVAQNDKLWAVLRQIVARDKKSPEPVPEKFQRELAGVRSNTARLIHGAHSIAVDEAQKLNDRSRKLAENLDAWLKEQK
jgi:hypothetical protein